MSDFFLEQTLWVHDGKTEEHLSFTTLREIFLQLYNFFWKMMLGLPKCYLSPFSLLAELKKKSLFFVWSLPKKVGSSPSSDRRILKMSISGQLQWKNSNMALLDIYVAKFMVHQKWKKVVEIITFMINGGHPNKKIHLYFVRCNNLCT